MIFTPLGIAIMLFGLVLGGLAQWRVKSTFHRYSQVGVRTGMTGAQAAAAVCRAAGVTGVTIERHEGFLSDHYDPTARALRLSPAVYDGRSVSSIAVAAHEAGHAIQHARAYQWLGLRTALVPVVQIGSQLWWLPVTAGAMLGGAVSGGIGGMLVMIGVGLFATTVLFQLITLPVEFDASNRAKAVLAGSGIVTTQEEARGVSSVLGAAALTYVAAALTGVLQLIHIVMVFTGGQRQE
jgi:Zn-dependent membrane protease YugP